MGKKERAGLCPLRSDLSYAILHRFDLTAQDRQRRPQFMRNIGQPLPLQQFVSLQALGHIIEIRSKLAELVMSPDLQPDVKAAGSQSSGGLRQFSNRRQQMSQQRQSHQ
jgi:hypothetical protein